MRITNRTTITPVTVVPGDTIRLTYTDKDGNVTEHLADTITRTQTFDEAFLFEDIIDGKNALGGGWLEQK